MEQINGQHMKGGAMGKLENVTKVRLQHLIQAKQAGEKITMLTAYDKPTAAIFDAAGIDLLLIGDSMGNAVLGYDTTLPVTLDDVVRATRAVAAGARRAMIVADLPFGTYEASPAQCFASAVLLMKAGAQGVKFEGGARVAAQIKLLSESGIPVMAHLGFTPQSVNTLGGNRVQGRDEASAAALADDALAVQEAGAFALVLELVPAALAAQITAQLTIPTVGIGAGSGTDGQVLVWTDMAGMGDWAPSFVRRFGDVGAALRSAANAYALAVRSATYPDPDHSF
ncbi:MAG: 3-methyl-2-oxobutanoate hydroxymethyltransferase [Bifidobacteriaceae bacterium]|jgi:3-methyl-2-oxobutanoate hydroxymethyltransferase|nr:3-methyl-2-oxobutanoate hydroxymethyltransferase [Bifidobacteriaceae bacterium]